MKARSLADGLTWWLAGWRPGPRPAFGTAVSLLFSLAVAAFWLFLPSFYDASPLLQAIGRLLARLGLDPGSGWRATLYGLCLTSALAQAAIFAADLFAPAAVRWRAGARAFADLASALFCAAVIVGFDLHPLEALEPGLQVGAWVALGFVLVGAGQAIRGLANLRQATRPQPAPVAAAA